MDDITELFQRIIQETGSIDMAEAEFKRMVGEDDNLKADYRQWCEEIGTTERRGFMDYATDYLEQQAEIWDNLKDYDDQ